jgi:mono/diheme cytochrome c family protein
MAEYYPAELARAERGRAIYAKLCVECHGEAGRGDGPRVGQLGISPGDFTDWRQRAEVAPAWYFRAISQGIVGTAMLGWEAQLNTQQRWDAAFYTWSLASSAARIDHGKVLYSRECASCHGARGLGDGPQAGQLPVPPFPLADPRILAGHSGAELQAAMTGGVESVPHDWSAELTEDDMRAIIDYVWTFLYQP